MAVDSKSYSFANKLLKIEKKKNYCNNRELLGTGFKAASFFFFKKKKVKENERSCVLGKRIFIRVYQTACIFQKI